MGGDTMVGDDGLVRCLWAVTNPLLTSYHDHEWGLPVHGDQALFERLCLEGFQAGLSWLTILTKRFAFRRAFADFDPEIVAGFDDQDLERLMSDRTIVRNRMKIAATRTNARATLALRPGGLDDLIWSFRPTTANLDDTAGLISTPESVALSKALKHHGFAFVGPTTMHALMEAVGMVDGHALGCHLRGTRLP